jgi:hypothetical protein
VTYIAVQWLHSNRSEPVELYAELDADRNEVRKVEVFDDGRAQFADGQPRSGDTMLGLAPVPTLEEIAADPQFVQRKISSDEFEAVWQRAHGSSCP